MNIGLHFQDVFCILPAATVKVGIVFNVSVYVRLCQQTKKWFLRRVLWPIKWFWEFWQVFVCSFVLLSLQNLISMIALQPFEMQTWNLEGVYYICNRLKCSMQMRVVRVVASVIPLQMASCFFLQLCNNCFASSMSLLLWASFSSVFVVFFCYKHVRLSWTLNELFTTQFLQSLSYNYSIMQ